MSERPGVLCITAHSDRPEAESFIGLRAAGFDVEVMCSAAAPHVGRLRAAGVPVTELDIDKRVDRAAVKVIRQRLASGRHRILHLYNNRAVSNGLRAARGAPVKIIAYRGIVGNVSFLSPVSWTRYLNPRVDRIVCVCEAIRRFFLDMRFAGLRLSPQKVVTIHKGHDLSWYDEPAVHRGEFGIPDTAFVIGCVANHRPRKGVEVLIEALAHLPPDAPIHLLLVGHMDGARLDKAIAASPMRERIHRAGFRADAPQVVAGCDISVLPATKREGLPKTVIESMVYGVAPVVTDVGGSPELVVDGESGLVVPPSDAGALGAAMTRLYEDPALRAQLGAAARVRIRDHFRIGDTVAATATLYRELLAEPAR